jgi:hypothetical protein
MRRRKCESQKSCFFLYLEFRFAPASLYRKLKEQAAAQGRSIRELILSGVRVTLIEGKRPRSKSVKFPLIASDGPKVDLTNEQIYEHIEFP